MTPEVFLSSARILNHRLWKWWLRFSMIISVKKRKLLVSWSLKNHWVVRSNNHHSLQTQRSTFQNNYIVNGVIGLIRITASIILSIVSYSDSSGDISTPNGYELTQFAREVSIFCTTNNPIFSGKICERLLRPSYYRILINQKIISNYIYRIYRRHREIIASCKRTSS